MSKKNRTIVVAPTQWAVYMVDADVPPDVYSHKNAANIPMAVGLEALAAAGRAERKVVTGILFNTVEEIRLPPMDDEDGFIGDDDGFAD